QRWPITCLAACDLSRRYPTLHAGTVGHGDRARCAFCTVLVAVRYTVVPHYGGRGSYRRYRSYGTQGSDRSSGRATFHNTSWTGQPDTGLVLVSCAILAWFL